MKFEIQAVDPSTGERLTLMVEAQDRTAAETIVRSGGMVLSQDVVKVKRTRCRDPWAYLPIVVFVAAFFGCVIQQPPRGSLAAILGSLTAFVIVAYIPAGIVLAIQQRRKPPSPAPPRSPWNPGLPDWMPWAVLAVVVLGVVVLALWSADRP